MGHRALRAAVVGGALAGGLVVGFAAGASAKLATVGTVVEIVSTAVWFLWNGLAGFGVIAVAIGLACWVRAMWVETRVCPECRTKRL